MKLSRRAMLSSLAVSGIAATAACSPKGNKTTEDPLGSGSSTISVMWNQPFYSYNSSSASGNATANANIVYMTMDRLNYYDKDTKLLKNEAYGKYEKISDSPLTVKVTLTENAKWSDGTPCSAADMIYAFGAVSGNFNNLDKAKAKELKNEDGTVKKVSGSEVYFNSTSPSLALITEFPEVGDNGKSITYKYSKPYADWELGLIEPQLPAHIAAKKALGIDDPTKGAEAVLNAFKNKENENLSKLSNFWNSGYDFVELPSDKDLLICNGPMKISEYKKDQYLSVTKNEAYAGDHKPQVGTITVRYNEDPLAGVQALANGEVQVIYPQATSDLLKALEAVKNVKVSKHTDGTYEHVDLTFNNRGPFDPASYGGDAEKAKKVRQAFLLTIPRQEIVDKIIKPLKDDAAVRNSFNVVPGSENYDATTQANGMATEYAKVDIAKAKQLLTEAGASSPRVRLLYAKTNKRRVAEFQLIQASAKQAGFQVVDSGSPDWGKKLGDKTYDASLFGWQSTSLAVTEAEANFKTGGNNNFGAYTNDSIDKLYTELQTTIDPARQKEINIAVEKQLVADAFGITVFQFPGVLGTSDKVEGVAPGPLSPTIFWNFWQWTIKK